MPGSLKKILTIALLQVRSIYASDSTCTIGRDSEERNRGRLETLELILAEDHEAIDKTLPSSIREIKKRGGHRCWHKHSTFLEHLVGVHNILRLWGEDEITGRVGLLHSAYSNSYVNLALFDPNEESERNIMRDMIGTEAEELVYLFCIVDRQSVVVNTLLAQGYIPEEGLYVPHLRDEHQNVYLSPKTLRMLVIFTMADVADQYFGWQDELFGGMEKTNSMLLPGNDNLNQHDSQALWPGSSRPGLWMSYVSELGQVAKTFEGNEYGSDSGGDKFLPPVFNYCTHQLTRQDEAKAIDLYWSVVMGSENGNDTMTSADAIERLIESTVLNPWFFESHVMLSQKYLHLNDNEKALHSAQRALDLQAMWATSYDKRMSFPAWVAWTRVLRQRAWNQEGWPENSWEVNNFGMVLPKE